MILQEHLEKEDEVLVSLAGLKQVSPSMRAWSTLMFVICFYFLFTCASSLFVCCCPGSCQIKDILKGALRFNQSQLEAEENEEITIADDHYTSTAAAETALSAAIHHQQQGTSRWSQDSNLDACVCTDEKEEEEQAVTPPEQQVNSSVLCQHLSWYQLKHRIIFQLFDLLIRYSVSLSPIIFMPTDCTLHAKFIPCLYRNFILCRIRPCDPKSVPLGNQTQIDVA